MGGHVSKFWLMDSTGGLLEGGSFWQRFLFLVKKGERHTKIILNALAVSDCSGISGIWGGGPFCDEGVHWN